MMNKRVKEGIKKFHKPNVRIKFCLGTIAIIFFCIMLLVTATFTQIKFGDFEYIPQIPVILFIAALLGDFWGLITILLYVIIGLFPQFPIFAMGGGLSYVLQYNFGYILAYIFAVIIAGKKFQKSDSITNVLLGILYGVLIIHIIGTIYMLIVALFQHASSDFILHWIYFQTISKILFDIAFGIIAVLIAKLFRKILWILIG